MYSKLYEAGRLARLLSIGGRTQTHDWVKTIHVRLTPHLRKGTPYVRYLEYLAKLNYNPENSVLRKRRRPCAAG
jgi:hypothetical protein